MPRKIVKTVYSFAELINLNSDSRAVYRARSKLSEIQTSHDWWDGVYGMWDAILGKMGFHNVEIRFRGFWNQGDGASFTADVNIDELITYLISPPANHNLSIEPLESRFKRIGRIVDYLDVEVGRDHGSRYVHENTTSFKIDLGGRYFDHPRVDKLIDEFALIVNDLRRQICQAIYEDLEKEYEWLVSDEQLIETAEANDYYFNLAGDIE